jgi:plasmid maintenance system antidote protein VapI
MDRYDPDTATPPGEVLDATLDARGMSRRDLARELAWPIDEVLDLVHARARMTRSRAEALQDALDVHADLWLGLEERYQSHIEGRLAALRAYQ